MQFNEYQEAARNTWVGKLPGTEMGRVYLALKLAGEAGEAAEKCGKLVRDKNGLMDIAPDDIVALTKELGDVLWYTAVLASELGVALDVVAMTNLEKLRDRKTRGTLYGSGDNR